MLQLQINPELANVFHHNEWMLKWISTGSTPMSINHEVKFKFQCLINNIWLADLYQNFSLPTKLTLIATTIMHVFLVYCLFQSYWCYFESETSSIFTLSSWFSLENVDDKSWSMAQKHKQWFGHIQSIPNWATQAIKTHTHKLLIFS